MTPELDDETRAVLDRTLKAFGSKEKPNEEESLITRDLIANTLCDVYDPEMGVSIVDLGLVYDIRVDEGDRVEIDLTLTGPGCPVGPRIISDIQQTLDLFLGVKDVKVNLVWSPPWSPSMMSEEAQDELGYFF